MHGSLGKSAGVFWRMRGSNRDREAGAKCTGSRNAAQYFWIVVSVMALRR